MRGIGVVLLLCFIGAAFAANCGNGHDGPNGDRCICNSGFGSTSQTVQCDQAVPLTCSAAKVSFTEATHFPHLDLDGDATYFTGNKLHASIVGDFVANRTYTALNFTGATSDNCALGSTNSYWTQNVRADYNCQDQFNFTLPWVNHGACNFKVNNNSGYDVNEWMVISGYLWISYVDALDEVESFKLTRSTKVPYAMSVKFQRHVNVQLLAVNVTSSVVFGVALTEDVYDPILQQLTLQLTTIVNWPNSFSEKSTEYKIMLPNTISSIALDSSKPDPTPKLDGTGIPILPKTIDCQVAPEFAPSCKQTWTLMVQQDDKTRCSFDGFYNMTLRLYTCRAPSGSSDHDCTFADQLIEYTISDSNTCGSIEVQPTLEGVLVSFPDTVTSGFRTKSDDPTAIKTTFSLGTYARFYAKINSGVGNSVSIVFNTIQFWDQADSSNKVTLYDSANVNAAMDPFCHPDNASKHFRIYFHSSIFKVRPNSKITYTFSATATVSFQGNDGYSTPTETKKREVTYTWEQSSMDATTNVFLASEESMVAPQPIAPTPAVNGVTFIASVVGAVAGTMIIVFVVVGFALRSRSKNEYKDVATSAALVAANAAAEVANRS